MKRLRTPKMKDTEGSEEFQGESLIAAEKIIHFKQSEGGASLLLSNCPPPIDKRLQIGIGLVLHQVNIDDRCKIMLC